MASTGFLPQHLEIYPVVTSNELPRSLRESQRISKNFKEFAILQFFYPALRILWILFGLQTNSLGILLFEGFFEVLEDVVFFLYRSLFNRLDRSFFLNSKHTSRVLLSVSSRILRDAFGWFYHKRFWVPLFLTLDWNPPAQRDPIQIDWALYL